MTGPCLSTADPCASFAAPLCDDDSDCDSAAVLLNPRGYWACAAHATTRPGPWRLVGPVACESDMDRSCFQWRQVGHGRALADESGRVSILEPGIPGFLGRYDLFIGSAFGNHTGWPPGKWVRRG